MCRTRFIWLTMVVLFLAACGGGGSGGGDGSGNPGSGNNNTAPVANAGAQQNVKAGALVRLDGSASSDADGDQLAYQWTFKARPSGSRAKLQHADSATPLFTADVAGTYVAQLVVNDGTAYSKPAAVQVVATAANTNSVPVADAGQSQNVKTSTVVHLDGSGSTDPDGPQQTLKYKWSFVSKASGSKASLSSANSAMPSFTADTAGDYVIQLVVSDGQASSAPDKVTIHASDANAAPNADAGSDRGVSVNDTVALDGSASSDANGDKLSDNWQLVSVPQGSGAKLEKAKTTTPSFVADAVGSYVAELTVTDSHGASDSDRVVITAGPTLKLRADLGNTGTFEDADLPYDKTYGQTVVHAPNTPDDKTNGFALGKFKVTAVGGDITLNLSFNIDNLTDAYALAFDRFQTYTTGAKQVVIPKGKTVEFTVNVGIPQNSKATISYLFNVVETGDSFDATYHVQSNDYQN